MEREILKNLEAWQNQSRRKPLLLKGARQVGKTYVLKDFGKRCFAKFHYLNFEEDAKLCQIFVKDLKVERILTDLSFHLNTSIDVKKDLLIFDEIQECPGALTSLKYFCENLPSSAVCAAGSHIGLHLSAESFPVGKIDELTLGPLTFFEFLKGIRDEKSVEAFLQLKHNTDISGLVHDHLLQRLREYFVTGGLPEVVLTFQKYQANLFEAFGKVREKQKQLLEDYFRDIAKHSGKINAMHIQRVFQSIPRQLARETESHRFLFKGVAPGIKRYSRLVGAIDWLEAAGLVLKVAVLKTVRLPFSAHAKDNYFKLYLFDIGLLGALSGLSPKSILEDDYGEYKGRFAENFVAQEFIRVEKNPLYSWQENTAELEFLYEHNGKIFPVEVKSGKSTRSKSLGVFRKKYIPSLSFVLSAQKFFYEDKKKIFYCPLYGADQILDLARKRESV